MSVLQVRGRGLLDAIVIKDVEGVSAYDVCMKLKEAGLLVSAAVSCHCESIFLEKHKAHSLLVAVWKWLFARSVCMHCQFDSWELMGVGPCRCSSTAYAACARVF